MDELSAFAGREVIRVLRDEGADLSAAFSRLRDVLTGDLLAACARLQSEFESTAKPTGDFERDGLRVAIRSVQLVQEHDGQFTSELWAELDRRQLAGFELSSSLVRGLLNTLVASSATAAIALVIAFIYGIFVLPQFASTYAAMGAELPSLTAAVLGGGGWIVLILVLLMMAASILAFPLQPGWGIGRHRRAWRLDLFSKRAVFCRAVANDYRRFLFVCYAATLVAAGIHPRKSLAAAAREAGIYTDLDFESAEASAMMATLPTQLMSADRLGHLREELATQRGLQADAIAKSIEGLQLRTAILMRGLLYFLVATLVIAMYLPIFKLGSII
ncbi:type IV pilus assembly protein PilC [Povalibacter uvarum]|uniref:Type IV pilus assembly protein PilC n=1 Tax=Povalibacter uvarum TaxID=732238 RepID=A0A841HRM0_9GAMM|nr:hypothetical protein [Povalibacter uvarum]MBB6095546.1 type IV pilus assembly protein PilC [Povalibacter uvarum]